MEEWKNSFFIEKVSDSYIILIESSRGCDIDCEIVTKTNDYKASIVLFIICQPIRCSPVRLSQSEWRISSAENSKGH